MSEKIKLTPSELQAQAAEMKSLESEYSSLFGGVSSELDKVNSNWSANLSHNFGGKINSTNKSFTQITQELMNGAKVADTCAVTFESVDSQLAKLYCDDNSSKAKNNDSASDIQTISDVMDWIDEYYSDLPDYAKQLIKSACKKMFGNGVSAYEIVKKMKDGDVFGVIWESVGAVAPSTFDWKNGGAISWTGLKLKAVSTVGKLVTDPDGYIQKNDEKYQDMMMDDLKNGDILGFVWDGAGSLVQTVGKGTVDATCKLISGTIDSYTEHLTEALFGYGVSWSQMNAMMYEVAGWSPGHAFNAVSKFVSDGVDTIIDGGSQFLSAVADQAYSDLKEFGDLVGGAATATVDFLGSAANSVGNFFKKLF